MSRAWERAADQSARFCNLRLPTPEDSRKSEEISESGSPRSQYSDRLANQPYNYPPILLEKRTSQDHPTPERRDSYYRESPSSPNGRAAEPKRQSLPPLRLVLEDSLYSPPHTPSQPSPREPSFTQNIFKPPALYPNRRSCGNASFDSTMSQSFRSASSSPGRSHSVSSLAYYSTKPMSAPEAVYQMSPNDARNPCSGSRMIPPLSSRQSQPYEEGLLAKTSSNRSNEYFEPQGPSHHHPQNLYAPDRRAVRHGGLRLPLPHAGFARNPRDEQQYPQSIHEASATNGNSGEVVLYGYAPRDQRPRKRSNLPKAAREIMKQWFDRNLHNPYPTEEQKAHFARGGGISMTQVSNWFINHRRRCPETQDIRQRSRT